MTMAMTVGQHQQRSPSSGGDRGDGGSFLHFSLFFVLDEREEKLKKSGAESTLLACEEKRWALWSDGLRE